jgi:hypothetical protein
MTEKVASTSPAEKRENNFTAPSKHAGIRTFAPVELYVGLADAPRANFIVREKLRAGVWLLTWPRRGQRRHWRTFCCHGVLDSEWLAQPNRLEEAKGYRPVP